MARWDKYWDDDTFVARNWTEPDPDIIRLTPVMQSQQVRRVLDLGCGAGRHLFYLSQHPFDVHGLDISTTGVERCRKALEQRHLSATLHVADMHHLPYPEGFFDWVLSVQVIYHTTAATLQQVIQHIRGKLRPGGFFYVTFPPVENIGPDSGKEIEPRTYLQEEDGEPLLHHYVTADEIDTLMDGFALVEKRLDPRETRDAAGNVTRRFRWNILGQRLP